MYPIDGPAIGAHSEDITAKLTRAIEDSHAARIKRNEALSVRYSVMFENTAGIDASATAILQFFRHASLNFIVGYSDGVRENSIIVDIIGRPSDVDYIITLARELKTLHKQSSVLVSWTGVSSVLV